MPTANIVIGVVLGILLGAVIIIFRRRYRDLFSILLVAGVVVLAVAVTTYRVQQFHQQQAAARREIARQTAMPAPSGGSMMPPTAPLPVRPAVVALPPSPLLRGATGGAAPETARNPYIGGGSNGSASDGAGNP